jgi:phosphoribosylanthranilate isomerase
MKEVENLKPDFIGLIFYKSSPRYIYNSDDVSQIKEFISTPKVGVFVNEELSSINKKISEFNLSFVQLHGEEDIDYIKNISDKVKIIKAIKIRNREDIISSAFYKHNCDYILFDTASSNMGGSGTKFNWNWLNDYSLNIPFILAGGISINDVEDIIKLKKTNKNFAGVDLNSKFEIQAGIKNTEILKQFISCIR